MEDERPFKAITESGTTYEFVDGRFFRIKEKGGYEYSVKPWQWFAFEENDPSIAYGMPGILEGAKRLPPAKGLRLMVYGKDDWRISTRIKRIKYGRSIFD